MESKSDEISKTLSQLSLKSKQKQVTISSNLEGDIDVMKEVIMFEINSIEGINIHDKNLPGRAFKSQLEKGREVAQKECPICNEQYRKRKIMVQCGYCARSCCSECCFKQRLDEKNRDKALICEECELLFLHFLMNKDFRKKEYLLNEAIQFTESQLRILEEDIEVENKRIAREKSEKENPEEFKKVMKLSNLKKEVVKDKAYIDRMEAELQQQEKGLIQKAKEQEIKKKEVEEKREVHRREKLRLEEEQRQQKQALDRQRFRKEEEQKVRLQFQRQKQILIQMELERQDKERVEKMAEDKRRTEMEIRTEELTEEEKDEKIKQLEVFRAEEQKREIERLRRAADEEAERREKERVREDEEKEKYRLKVQALERENLRFKQENQERERVRLQELEQKKQREELERQEKIRQQQLEQKQKMEQSERENERLRMQLEEQERVKKQDEEKRKISEEEEEKKQKREKQEREEEEKRKSKVYQAGGSQSTSEVGKEDALTKSGTNFEKKLNKNITQAEILKIKIPMNRNSAGQAIPSAPKVESASRSSNPPTPIRVEAVTVNQPVSETDKRMSKEEIFRKSRKTDPGDYEANEIDEKPKCACLLF